MKKYFVFLFFIALIKHSYAQQSPNFEFIGTIQLTNSDLLTFKINYTELENGKIVGSAITDIYGADRTKSKIEGFINRKEGKISFKELSNISTKSASNESEFCFIHLNNAKINTIKNKTSIQGNFVGKYKNGEECARGTIYLISTNYLEVLEKKILESDKVKKHDSISVLKEKIGEYKLKTENTVLNYKEDIKINWKSNEVIIEVWDGEREDYDEIGITVNDKPVLDRLILRQQKKSIIVPYSGDITTIKVTGINEGNSSPCTANILLKDGENNTPIVTVLKKGQFATLTLVKEK